MEFIKDFFYLIKVLIVIALTVVLFYLFSIAIFLILQDIEIVLHKVSLFINYLNDTFIFNYNFKHF